MAMAIGIGTASEDHVAVVSLGGEARVYRTGNNAVEMKSEPMKERTVARGREPALTSPVRCA
jgi:hypothetical protein